MSGDGYILAIIVGLALALVVASAWSQWEADQRAKKIRRIRRK